jgi:hypothetical protein
VVFFKDLELVERFVQLLSVHGNLLLLQLELFHRRTFENFDRFLKFFIVLLVVPLEGFVVAMEHVYLFAHRQHLENFSVLIEEALVESSIVRLNLVFQLLGLVLCEEIYVLQFICEIVKNRAADFAIFLKNCSLQ